MKQHASVLVVVLGLLAILAVIGVAFLTLSSLERSTATSFALQTQMMIAADGALDYAVHQMVIDVWEWQILLDNKFEFTGTGKLLTGREVSGNPAATPHPPPYYSACEAYDCPSAAADAWLSSNITVTTAPSHISFAVNVAPVPKFYVNFGGTTAAVENLGFPPVAAAPKNGIWIPDLAAPCDQYLIRASVTILDHNALVNLNAHGSKDTWDPNNRTGWQYGDCIGKGYFISDVQPEVNLTSLLSGIPGSNPIPGCWGPDDKPGNPEAGAVLIENPAAGNDVPYTLDEEFELRNLWGTYFTSRLEQFWPAIKADPDASSSSLYTNRLKVTTVSWTAEVRGDGNAATHVTMKDSGWSAAKADLNTASADDIYNALNDAGVFANDFDRKQFVANVVAFRDFDNQFEVEYGGCVGAERQPFFSEVLAQFTEKKVAHPEDTVNPEHTVQEWTITVELFNPWPGDNHLTSTLNLAQMAVPGFSPDINTKTMDPKSCKFTPAVDAVVTQTFEVDRTAGESVNDKLGVVVLKVNVNDIIIDSIPEAKMEAVAAMAVADGNPGRMYREFGVEPETCGTRDSKPIPVAFIYNWRSPSTAQGNPGKAGGGGPNDEQSIKEKDNTGIPIRIMNSVRDTYNARTEGSLPLRYTTPGTDSYKAFARLGEMNRVLCPKGLTAGNWWDKAWVNRITETDPVPVESDLKFDWFTYPRAANMLSVGGPWNDGLDNDGDGKTDLDDTGKPNAGRPGGPEFRVAGKINLNTATPDTLTALESGTGAAGLATRVTTLRGPPSNPTPITSPVQVIPAPETPNGIEFRDNMFTRISNIATVRSDTFSVYGTVQIVDPPPRTGAVNIPDSAIVRTRRFWALVDRSPSLAYPPTDKANFIYPRILNFQWLD
jgi:hypothetical protein